MWFTVMKPGLMLSSLEQAFMNLDLTPGEAAAILRKAKHYLRKEITWEELSEGKLQELLVVEDFTAQLEVLFKFTRNGNIFCKIIFPITCSNNCFVIQTSNFTMTCNFL